MYCHKRITLHRIELMQDSFCSSHCSSFSFFSFSSSLALSLPFSLLNCLCYMFLITFVLLFIYRFFRRNFHALLPGFSYSVSSFFYDLYVFVCFVCLFIFLCSMSFLLLFFSSLFFILNNLYAADTYYTPRVRSMDNNCSHTPRNPATLELQRPQSHPPNDRISQRGRPDPFR